MSFVHFSILSISFSNSLQYNYTNRCVTACHKGEEAYMLVNAENLRAEDLRREHDVYVVDPQFTWTYVQTHEYYCGPYFYRKYSQEGFRFNE
ncbi:DUF4275 family protein [Geobacillus stearothermophilus]|nr:DUF4275 family protein [Geobacillus stearothermophilus]